MNITGNRTGLISSQQILTLILPLTRQPEILLKLSLAMLFQLPVQKLLIKTMIPLIKKILQIPHYNKYCSHTSPADICNPAWDLLNSIKNAISPLCNTLNIHSVLQITDSFFYFKGVLLYLLSVSYDSQPTYITSENCCDVLAVAALIHP